MKTTVGSRESASFSISYAVSISSVEITSSKTMMGVFCTNVRAISILRFSPLEILDPFVRTYKLHVNFLCIYEDNMYQEKTLSRTNSNAFGNQAVDFSGSESRHFLNSSTDNHIISEISSSSTSKVISFECSGK